MGPSNPTRGSRGARYFEQALRLERLAADAGVTQHRSLTPEVRNSMRITELKGRPVVDRATARTLGRIVDVFVDATGARIVAVEVATPGREDCVRIPAE